MNLERHPARTFEKFDVVGFGWIRGIVNQEDHALGREFLQSRGHHGLQDDARLLAIRRNQYRRGRLVVEEVRLKLRTWSEGPATNSVEIPTTCDQVGRRRHEHQGDDDRVAGRLEGPTSVPPVRVAEGAEDQSEEKNHPRRSGEQKPQSTETDETGQVARGGRSDRTPGRARGARRRGPQRVNHPPSPFHSRSSPGRDYTSKPESYTPA